MEAAANYHHQDHDDHHHHQVVVDRDQQNQTKWQGKATTKLKTCKPHQVWPLLEDFFGLGKWFPTLSTCLPVQGISGQPGCIRYCAGFKTPVDNHSDNKTSTHDRQGRVNWTKQKLLSIDPVQMAFSYSIVDGNVGFNSYISTLKVSPEGDGCSIEWRYEVDPVEGWRPEDLDGFIGTGLQAMATRMEAALQDYFEVTKS